MSGTSQRDIADSATQAKRRVHALRSGMDDSGAEASALVVPANQAYFTGFSALIYSRPIVLFVDRAASVLVVPGLEEAHAHAEAAVDEVRAYYEHPAGVGARSADEHLDEMLRQLPLGSRVGVEYSHCPLAIAERIMAAGHRPIDIEPVIIRMRQVKDSAELEMMFRAAEVVNAAVRRSVETVAAGVTEIQIDEAGITEASVMVSGLGVPVTLEHLVMSPSGTERTVLPHVFSTTRRLAVGDIVIHSRQVSLAGYHVELERTLVVGEPADEQARVFSTMREAQRMAIGAVCPGATGADVDRAARAIIEDAGLAEFAVHRTGHGIGLSVHEPPYLRFDNSVPLDEGMVVTIEPGIYIPGLGGFRHSDTVVVRDDGPQVITSFSSDLASLSGQREARSQR